MKILPTILISALFLTGCSYSNFTPYSGRQLWKTSEGALVENRYKLPIYLGIPDKPYEVLGVITVRGGGYSDAVSQALKHNADAVALINSSRQYAGTLNNSSAFVSINQYNATATSYGSSVPLYRTTLTFMAIKFMTGSNVFIENAKDWIVWADAHPFGGTLNGKTMSADDVSAYRSNVLDMIAFAKTNNIHLNTP